MAWREAGGGAMDIPPLKKVPQGQVDIKDK